MHSRFLRGEGTHREGTHGGGTIVSLVFAVVILFVATIVLYLAIFFPVRAISTANDGVCDSGRVVGRDNVGVKSGVFAFNRGRDARHLGGGLPFVRGIRFRHGLPGGLCVGMSSTGICCYLGGNSDCCDVDRTN